MSVLLAERIAELKAQTRCEETAKMLDRINTLFGAVAHGEQGHRDWLEQAIENHFLGLPMPDYVAK